MINWIRTFACAFTISIFCCSICIGRAQAEKQSPWSPDAVIYTIYPAIFSPSHNFQGVTAQLPRLHRLGANVIWLMPITPIGKPINGHPAIGSPYCVHDYYKVNPDFGTESALRTLITDAHRLGIKVILDEVLNHTSWDNPLITTHPDFYCHSDSNINNPATIKMAFNYSDVAQLNYANPQLRKYVIAMLSYWVSKFDVDGFRFDCVDNPDGPNRMIPADFWSQVDPGLAPLHKPLLMIGECDTPDLALKPFTLEYGWRMYGALKDASNGGDASQVKTEWDYEERTYPRPMKHMYIQDDWDDTRDVNTFGGPTGAEAAAIFNFTCTGIPLIYNGMEIGNKEEAVNPHGPINWAAGDPSFATFYQSLSTLRRNTKAINSGTMTWIPNSAPKQLLSYIRQSGNSVYLVVINLSSAPVNATVSLPLNKDWKEVQISGRLNAHGHSKPSELSLQPKDFAVFRQIAVR